MKFIIYFNLDEWLGRFLSPLLVQNSEKIFLFYRPTDAYFSNDVPVENQIIFVSPYSSLALF